MDRSITYIFPYSEEHLEWLDLKTKYYVVKEQGMPKFIGFSEKGDALLYKLKWTKNENN